MESRTRWNHTTGTARAVSIVGRTNEFGLLTFLELADALIPASDNLTDADLKLKWCAALYA